MNKNKKKNNFNLFTLLYLEKKHQKRKNIPYPMSKLKSSILLNDLVFTQNKKDKKLNLINPQQNSNINKNKKINFPKFSEQFQLKNFIYEKRNSSKNKNINKLNNNINIKNNFESNAIEYFINSSNSIQKKRYSHSVHEQRKKVINDIYSKKHNKEKEINFLKLSSNNTNSTSLNTNNTNNFNSKNYKIKITLSTSLEELKKDNQNLKTKIEIIGKENKILNKKINKLRDKYIELRKILYSLRKDKDDYSQSINQSLKILKSLKKNGLELSEIMENLSNSLSDKDEENEDENLKVIFDDKNLFLDCFSENDKNKKNDDSSFTNVSFGRLECHEEFSLKKFPRKLNYIPKLNIHNIRNENI